MNQTTEHVAGLLDDAAVKAQAIEQFAPGSFDLDQAYRIQRASIERRIARGDGTRGIKLGFTSRAKMIQMGVNDLIWGWLTERMLEAQRETVGVHFARWTWPAIFILA